MEQSQFLSSILTTSSLMIIQIYCTKIYKIHEFYYFTSTPRETEKPLKVAVISITPIQLGSVAQLCPTVCNHIVCSTPGFPVHHQLPELAQTHVHRVKDATQPSHRLLSPSPPAFNLSHQHQSFPMSQFFASGGQSIYYLAYYY